MKKLPITTMNDICMACGKMPQSAFNRPHSQHKTKKAIYPNLGRWNGMNICAKCRKTLSKPDRVRKVQPVTTEAAA